MLNLNIVFAILFKSIEGISLLPNRNLYLDYASQAFLYKHSRVLNIWHVSA